MKYADKDATNSWKLYGVNIRILLPQTHHVTQAVVESLGIEGTESPHCPGPEILIQFVDSEKLDVNDVRNADFAEELSSVNVPRMLGSYPCTIECSRDDGFSRFRIKTNIHLAQNTVSRCAFKLLTADYFDLAQHEVSCLKYYVIRRILEACLLEVDKSFLHASAVSRANKATLISGTSHAGKTTLAMALIQEGGFKIMADDFPVVTQDGLCLPNPEPVNVEPSIERLNDRIELWLSTQSMMNMIHWRLRARIFGDKRAVRRVPLRVIGEYHDSDSRIGDVIHVERSGGDRLTFEDVSPTELARRLALILGEELEPIRGLLASNGEGHRSRLNIESLVGRAQKVYEKCLGDTNCTIAQIPEGENMRLVSRKLAGRLR